MLELDELWSFVDSREQVFWWWIALCRRTRQVVGFFLGDRSEDSCQALQWMIAPEYQGCATVSDGLASYQVVFGKNTGA